MNTDAYIDGTSLRSIGVYMGDNFLDTCLAPPQFKDFTQNDARTQHGVQVLTSAPRYSSREFSLTFIICGDTSEEMLSNKKTLLALLENVKIGLYIPSIMENETLWLVYTGKNATISTDLSRTVAKLTTKFLEPDPSNRTVATWVADL